ncbi:hypothetical protein [Mixta sp. Marseille-Q2659]|uniref:hypothetical protein n=1 Tax=Mixta sp. Marseille-Q2659 TaxID=2736607 RepID=UPI0023B9FEE2|nr:hypothetical protein [Mixta sp. Marseille-Q2659]
MKETMALIMADGFFTEKPNFVEVSDIISYLVTRESYSRPEDADGSPVKQYGITVKIEIEEIK